MEVKAIKEALSKRIENHDIGQDVLSLLLPSGEPFNFETELWDYKREALGADADQSTRKLKLHEILKDIVSFHNSYGGYLVFGIEEKPKWSIVGCSDILDVGDITKAIKAYTNSSFDCYFAQHKIIHEGSEKCIGLLLIPRRLQNIPAVRFVKTPSGINGKCPYVKDSVYVRINDECRPASSNAEDWSFLFSPRIYAAPEVQSIPLLRSTLPARDPDMINFVGREDELSRLRDWILDTRSPVRLITGIGGLGKTAIAYTIAEEVISAPSSEFDMVIWVTAKQRTYAALRGKMIETTRHDFKDARSLVARLLIEVAGESSIHDDMDLDELTDVLVEALEIHPCLFIVDDIDSLDPDEQRICVSIMQEIAIRTLRRDHYPSRVLMTARLDQGLSPTNVIRIEGLPEKDFFHHLDNLSSQFKLSEFDDRTKRKVHTTASGSPLFGAAIVRLCSLGENPKVACDRWAGLDGEDVREFAFRRELERLSSLAACILLAVVRLNEASLDDLEQVAGVSRKKITDLIGELQSFHLVARSESSYGNFIFSVSRELTSVLAPLHEKLGARGKEIEKECAKLKAAQGDQTRPIGIGISQMVRFWNSSQNDEALIVARELAAKFPKNGDVQCALAGAFLKVRPILGQEASEAIDAALRHKCQRPEMQDYFIMAKSAIEDWKAILDFVKDKTSNRGTSDSALDAFIVASSRLISIYCDKRDYKSGGKYAYSAVERISRKIASQAVSPDYFRSLGERQLSFSKDYLRCVKQQLKGQGDELEVVGAALSILELGVASSDFLLEACVALESWFSGVERRPIVDLAALDILVRRLERIQRCMAILSGKAGNFSIIESRVERIVRDLEYRGAKLRIAT